MTQPTKPPSGGYEQSYSRFDSPMMRALREEAYGEDIGQHSWVTADELRRAATVLGLSPQTRLLDLGCGPGGPLLYLLRACNCIATGLDVSSEAIAAAKRQAASENPASRLTLLLADLNEALPFSDRSFDVVLSIDVILHATDRLGVFREVARVLEPGGKFLFTDAGVLAAPISNEDVRVRSACGFTQFCPPGFNERALKDVGFQVISAEDRTDGLLRNASGRLAARARRRDELARLEGLDGFNQQQQYLNTVISLARRGTLMRMMYVAHRSPTDVQGQSERIHFD